MKAKVNGIEIEGTPEEIAKFMEMSKPSGQPMVPNQPFKRPNIYPYGTTPPPWKLNEIWCQQ